MATPTRKLSKRMGDPTMNDLCEQGYLLDAIVNYIALLGWSPRSEREFFTINELCEAFDLEGLSKSPALFVMDKLTWFNAEYTRRLPPEEYLRMAEPWFEKALGAGAFDARRLAELTQGRTEAFNRLPEMVGFLADMPEYDLDLYTHKKMKTDPTVALSALKLLKPALEAAADWTEEALHSAIMAAVEASGLKTGQMLWPLRVALSGRASTPGGAVEIAYLLGRDEGIGRADRAIDRLSSGN
jgi:glutamyl-tRNA synthetase